MEGDQLRRLTTTRGAHRGQMTKLLTKADECKTNFADPPLSVQRQTYQAILDSIQTKFEQLKLFDEQIADGTKTEELEAAICEADDYLNDLNVRIQVHRHYLHSVMTTTGYPGENGAQATNNASATPPSSHKNKVNLPKLLLPKFDGNFLKWLGFKDSFEAAVDKDLSLEDIQKFQYLIAHLSGEAAKTIEGLQLTSSNYKEALELLEKRYGQPHKLIACYMKALWELPRPSNAINSVRDFHDTLESHIRGLRSLGKTEDSYGDLLVPIIFDKLPGNIKTQISRDHGDQAWTIHALKDALYKEIQAAQAGNIEYFENGANLSTTTAFHVGSGRSRKPATYGGKTAPTSYGTRSCAFCKGTHYHTECVVVTDIEQRKDIVQRNSLCFNCLRGKHRAQDCLAKGRCRNCGQKHHTSLCYKSERREEGRKSDSSHTSHDTHVKLTPTSSPVLLKTAVGTITTDTGTASVNILLDEGAQRSFITHNVATRLGINLETCEREHINLATFGTTSSSGVQAISAANIRLQTRQDSVDIRTLIVPKISSPVKNYTTATIEHYGYLRNLQLAQPVQRDFF